MTFTSMTARIKMANSVARYRFAMTAPHTTATSDSGDMVAGVLATSAALGAGA